jgi:mono/diheme cytochrome c family protein
MSLPRRCAAGLLGIALLIPTACNRKEGPTAPPEGPPTGPPPEFMPKPPILEEVEPHAAGKKVYNANGCVRCHMMGGPPIGPPGGPPIGPPGGPPGPPPLPGKGPDLAKVANHKERNVEWFMKYVSNPRSVKEDSKMPPFEKKINETDLRALAEFLASLK